MPTELQGSDHNVFTADLTYQQPVFHYWQPPSVVFVENSRSIKYTHVMRDGIYVFRHKTFYIFVEYGLVEIPAFRDLLHAVGFGDYAYKEAVIIQDGTPGNTMLGKQFHYF
jgi:hypothetical protein